MLLMACGDDQRALGVYQLSHVFGADLSPLLLSAVILKAVGKILVGALKMPLVIASSRCKPYTLTIQISLLHVRLQTEKRWKATGLRFDGLS